MSRPARPPVIVLFRPEAEELGNELLAAFAGETLRSHFDVARRDAQPRSLVLDRMHRLHAERAALHFLDRCLLIGDASTKNSLLICARLPHVVERVHRVVNVMRRMIGFGCM